MISVVILTLNEAGNMPRCLDSIQWCDDVIIVDSGSSDDTVEIAKAAGARVLVRKFDTFANQRNHAMEHGGIRHEWVLHLDADEVVTPELHAELMQIAATANAQFPVYRVPSRLIFLGRWLRYSGMYPAYQVRFGRRALMRFVDHGHGQREATPPNQVGTVSQPFDHYNFSKGINDWFARHLRYAYAEAGQALAEGQQSPQWRNLFSMDPTVRRRAVKSMANRAPFRPAMRFFYSYIVRRGFLDGRAGFQYSLMVAVYQYFIDLNIKERRLEDAGRRP